MMKKERLYFLDAARGLCMLLVILGHTWETDAPVPVLIYSFHIPLFFIISGILLAYTKAAEREPGPFLLARLKGLLIPYLFFELLFVAAYGVLNHFDFGGQHLYGFLLLNPLNVPLWFLPTLFLVELLAFLLLRADKSGRLMTAVCAILYLIPFFVKSGESLPVAAALRCCTSAGFFALGFAACGIICEKTPPPAVPVLLFLANAAAALFNGKTGIYKLTFGNPFLFTFCAAAGSFAVLYALKYARVRLLEWIGENTLVILGLHIIVLRVVQLIPGLNTDRPVGGLAAMVLICVLLTPVILCFNRFAPVLAGRKPAGK